MRQSGFRFSVVIACIFLTLACSLFSSESQTEEITPTTQPLLNEATVRAMEQAATGTVLAIQQTQLSLQQAVTDTPEPSPTADRNAAFTQTAAVKEATSAVQKTSTAQVIEATSSALSSLIGADHTFKQAFGPQSGQLAHDPSASTVKRDLADVNLLDFVVQAHFFNPYGSTTGRFSYGFMFRRTGRNLQYRLIVRSNRRWELNVTKQQTLQGYANSRQIKSGTLNDLDISEGGSNVLMVVAIQENGKLYVNGKLVTEFNLGDWMESGDIAAGTGFDSDDEITGKITKYSDFTVWSIQQ